MSSPSYGSLKDYNSNRKLAEDNRMRYVGSKNRTEIKNLYKKGSRFRKERYYAK